MERLCENCAVPQNFHIRKLGEITGFFVVGAKIKTLIGTETGILDSDTNYNSQDNDNMSSIIIKEKLIHSGSQLKRKNKYDLIIREINPMNICSNQNKERTHLVKSDQELSEENQKENQTSYTNREIPEKKQWFIRN